MRYGIRIHSGKGQKFPRLKGPVHSQSQALSATGGSQIGKHIRPLQVLMFSCFLDGLMERAKDRVTFPKYRS